MAIQRRQPGDELTGDCSRSFSACEGEKSQTKGEEKRRGCLTEIMEKKKARKYAG